MKQKVHTDFIRGLLKKTLGTDAQTDSIPVFEIVATSSTPLKKQGLYKGAVITPMTIAQMAYAVNKEALPLMEDHNMEGSPKGKFFYAEMQQNDGRTELRGLIYVDPTETQLVRKVDLGTQDESSVGFLPQALKCSACGFDYMTALTAENYEPLITLTCDKGHKIGKDGVHVLVDGLDDFMELSLVSRGAAPNSKIIGNDNAKLGQYSNQLAASGFDVNELYLTASASEGANDVDITELVTQLTDVKTTAAVDKLALTARAETAESAVATLTARADTAEARVTELETELTTAKEAVAPSEDAAALTAAVDFLKGQFTAVLAASGKPDEPVPETVAELVAGIISHRATLSAILPIGGVAASANHTDKKEDKSLSSFKAK